MPGTLKPTSGSIVSNGTNLVGMATYAIAEIGIKYVFPQDKKVFSDLTVRENLKLAATPARITDWDPVTDFFPKLKRQSGAI